MDDMGLFEFTTQHKQAIDDLGESNHLLLLIEQLTDLIEAISHRIRTPKNETLDTLIDEIAEAEAMFEQTKYLFRDVSMKTTVADKKQKKLEWVNTFFQVLHDEEFQRDVFCGKPEGV